MDAWTLFFVVVGVSAVVAQLFRVVDAIEAPARRRKTRHE